MSTENSFSKLKNIFKKENIFYIIKLASAITTQLASLYLVYVMTPSEFGKFVLVASVAQLMYVLTSGWSNGSVINLGSQSFAKSGSYKSIVIYRVLIVAVMLVTVCSIFLLLGDLIEKYINISGMFFFVMLLYLGYVLYDHASQLLYPGNRDLIQSGAEFTTSFTLFLLVIYSVKDIQSYVYAYTAVSFVFFCFISILFINYYADDAFKWSLTEFKKVVNYSAWQIISVVSIYIINMGMNYVFVFCGLSFEQVGIYNLSYRLYSGFGLFFALFGIVIPKWIHASTTSFQLLEPKLLKIVTTLGVLYLVAGFALTPLLNAFEMQRYLDSVIYFFWLFPAFLLSSYSNLLNTVLANTESFRRAQVGVLVQSSLIIISSIPLVALFGIYGAVVAMTIASVSGAIYFKKIHLELLIKNNT